MTSTPSDRVAAAIFKYIDNHPSIGEITYYFDKESKDELIHGISSIVQSSTHCNTISSIINQEIDLIKSDERFPEDPSQEANVFANAPLALIQMGMKGKVDAYRHALAIIG